MMCAYNKVNGAYACGNDALLNGAIKQAIGFKGWIMSDWKAVYDWDFALKGLDQHSGVQLDQQEWFVGPLREAYDGGRFPRERLSDMVRRVLRSVYAVGVDKRRDAPALDLAAHRDAVLEVVRQGIVLLKNEGGLLPLSGARRIAVIGGLANIGAMGGGGGSSQVIPVGGHAMGIPLGGDGVLGGLRRMVLNSPAPLAELQRLMPQASITFDSGEYPAQSAALARRSDVAIVFASKFESEGFDSPDLSLPFGQDDLIAAVAAANPNTVVVLQTGNPVSMPWRHGVKAILAAWYAGQAGGQPIAEVLSGKINPSGRLPVTFVASLDQTPHPELAGFGTPSDTPTTIHYHEGAEIGYRWLHRTGATPLFAFGHGLSYTAFAYGDLQLAGGETVTATFTVSNTGERTGAAVPQVYLLEAPAGRRIRLLGFERVALKPGESRQVSVTADPRLLASYDGDIGQWRIDGGSYRIGLSDSAVSHVATGTVQLTARRFGR